MSDGLSKRLSIPKRHPIGVEMSEKLSEIIRDFVSMKWQDKTDIARNAAVQLALRREPMSEGIKKLLDRGCMVVLFRNGLKTYTSAVVEGVAENKVRDAVEAMDDFALTHTDDFEPSKSLERLSEKMFRTGQYQEWGQE